MAQDEHNRGSTDPIVARTVMQAGKIVSLYEFSHEKEVAIVYVFEKIRRHLHQCDDISRKIVKDIKEKTVILHKNLGESRSKRILHLPAAENLTNDLETYLYHAKLTFRELKDLFFYSLDKKFKQTTQYSHIADWAEKRFGKSNTLSRWLRNNCDWIQKIIDSRNAVEHPETHTIEIKNFYATNDGTIHTPCWGLDDEPLHPILEDMEILTTNILEFSEILLLYCLRNVKDISPIIIAEIPIENRDEDAPMRFIATLKQDIDESGMYKWKTNKANTVDAKSVRD